MADAQLEAMRPFSAAILSDVLDGLGLIRQAMRPFGGPTERIAPWGELLSTAARARGAAGCVIDGLVRDVRQIREMRFPVFHGGIGPLDTRRRDAEGTGGRTPARGSLRPPRHPLKIAVRHRLQKRDRCLTPI
jgi:hypothetical protein